MKGRGMKVLGVLILVCFLVPIVFAQTNQTDSLSIITYYPAPYGVYTNIRLKPGTAPVDGVSPGLIYYNESENVAQYSNGTAWLNIGGGSNKKWAVIQLTCPWGSDYRVGVNHGWGNQCNFTTNNCCSLPGCPTGWTEIGTGIELTGVSCPRHPKNKMGACEWNATDPGYHPVAIGNMVRTCMKQGATVITNSTTWWSDHSTLEEFPNKEGWGDQCVGPNFPDCYTEFHSMAIPRTRVLPTCPSGWTRIALHATVQQVSCYHNLEASDSPGCVWDGIWSTEHPLANGQIVAVCEKN